jgi:hypothetical protein
MAVTELLPQLSELSRADKLHVMQFLVSELVQEETELLKPDMDYAVWSPYNAFEAANMMLKVLKVAKENHDAE